MTQRSEGNSTLFAFYCQHCTERTHEHDELGKAVLDWNSGAEPEIEAGPAQKAFLDSIDAAIVFHEQRNRPGCDLPVVEALKAVKLAAIEASNAERNTP